MQSLNPFLRAFFRSTLPAQCTPINQHILLVPLTEVLLSNKDRETNTPFSELALNDDFLGSHVLRVPLAGPDGTKEIGNIREHRSKARQFGTVNGKTVVIKESYVYSNKGFRTLNQAQLLFDTLFHEDGLDAQQWLIYYISKPLTGTIEPIKMMVPKTFGKLDRQSRPSSRDADEDNLASSKGAVKRDINSLQDVLGSFPIIARQLQPGLEKVVDELRRDATALMTPQISNSPVPPVRRTSSSSSASTAKSAISGDLPYNKNSRLSSANSIISSNKESQMRRVLETAVMTAIDIFQLVDKQQLSLLGATTNLTGPQVERLIERYIVEQIHQSVLEPWVCNMNRLEDLELESRIRHLLHVDITQVGIEIEGGRKGKEGVLAKLKKGIDEFKKLTAATNPQSMLAMLVETQRLLISTSPTSSNATATTGEKLVSTSMNADVLVSLLLIVVIRANVRNLRAKLHYMQAYIITEDVESGELGYALSTFEAVLTYLITDSGGLQVASRRNKRLWQATKHGNISEMKTILEPEDGSISDEPESTVGSYSNDSINKTCSDVLAGSVCGHTDNQLTSGEKFSEPPTDLDVTSSSFDIPHYPPYQRQQNTPSPVRPKPVKRVSIDLRSLSSDISFRSRTSTLTSMTSIVGDTSIDKLSQTQDMTGNSVLMMAVDAGQHEALDYLLSLDEYYPTDIVLEDTNCEGTTLLSAAVQMSSQPLIEVLVDYVCAQRDSRGLREYISKPDYSGRTVAHYMFHAPSLLGKFGSLLPWRHKDKNGQTPLLALCRSYDHPDYLDMVNTALRAATEEQADGQPLHLDNHIDLKGNSLLHVVTEPYLALRILQHCDADPNASNEKQFTPLMVASKFGRFDLVRALFLDSRVDLQAKEYRGMTAVELAKDDDVRNRMDDMVLVSNVPAPDGRATSVVRSFFVEDGTIRLILKTAARSSDGMIAVTTCRRSLTDFEHLAKWLAIEHPASWLPSIFTFRSPFQILSRPSRAILHDIQARLDKFLQTMLAHSTFSTHEMLWEFILVPDIQPEMMAERSLLKSQLRQEKIKEEYEPLVEYGDVESFVTHAQESIRAVSYSTKSSLRRINAIRNASNGTLNPISQDQASLTKADLFISLDLAARPLTTLQFVPLTHITAFNHYTRVLKATESDPSKLFHTDLLAISSTFLAILSALARPYALISDAQAAKKNLERYRESFRRSDRWPLGLLEETRKQAQLDAQKKISKVEEELRVTGCELRYTQQTVASELAGWQELHGKMTQRALKSYVKRMVIRERDRLDGMRRALRPLLETKENSTDG